MIRPGRVAPSSGSAHARTETAAFAGSLSATLAMALVRQGVDRVVISPGARSGPLAIACADRPELALNVVLDERAAGFFALGMVRATGRPVALICTSGSAVAHYLPALVEAEAEGLALVVLTADRPAELHGVGAAQTLVQSRLLAEACRFVADLGTPPPTARSHRHAALLVARAVLHATGADPGPVCINVPLREPLFAADEAAPGFAFCGPRVHAPKARSSEAELEVLALSLSGRQGVIWGGAATGGDRDPELSSAVERLATALGWPVLGEITSQLRGQTGPALCATPWLFHASDLPEPQIVLRVGRAPLSPLALAWLSRCPEQVLLGTRPRPSDPDATITSWVLGDVVSACLVLAERVGPAPVAWQAEWARANAVATAAVDRVLADGAQSGPFGDAPYLAAVSRALGTQTILHVGSSSPLRDVDAFIPCLPPGALVLAHRGLNGIDGHVAAATGEAAGSGRPVVAILGDLTFLHDASSLIVARALASQVDLTLVVLENGGGRIFERLTGASPPRHLERLFLTPQPVDIGSVAAGYGVDVQSVRSPDELSQCLDLYRGLAGVRVLVCAVDSSIAARDRDAVGAHVASAREQRGCS